MILKNIFLIKAIKIIINTKDKNILHPLYHHKLLIEDIYNPHKHYVVYKQR